MRKFVLAALGAAALIPAAFAPQHASAAEEVSASIGVPTSCTFTNTGPTSVDLLLAAPPALTFDIVCNSFYQLDILLSDGGLISGITGATSGVLTLNHQSVVPAGFAPSATSTATPTTSGGPIALSTPGQSTAGTNTVSVGLTTADFSGLTPFAGSYDGAVTLTFLPTL